MTLEIFKSPRRKAREAKEAIVLANLAAGRAPDGGVLPDERPRQGNERIRREIRAIERAEREAAEARRPPKPPKRSAT